MFFRSKKLLYAIVLPLLVCSCNAAKFYNETYLETRNFELGLVQKEIHEGMAQDQVAIAIGTPNIVTSDNNKKEDMDLR